MFWARKLQHLYLWHLKKKISLFDSTLKNALWMCEKKLSDLSSAHKVPEL